MLRYQCIVTWGGVTGVTGNYNLLHFFNAVQ